MHMPIERPTYGLSTARINEKKISKKKRDTLESFLFRAVITYILQYEKLQLLEINTFVFHEIVRFRRAFEPDHSDTKTIQYCCSNTISSMVQHTLHLSICIVILTAISLG